MKTISLMNTEFIVYILHNFSDLHLFILSQAVQGLYLMEEESQFFECITLDEVELLLK